MASTPATNTAASAASFKPFFQRISQGEDRHADVLACCAMLCNKSLADTFKQAETHGLPKVGPYYGYSVDSTLSCGPPIQRKSSRRTSSASPI